MSPSDHWTPFTRLTLRAAWDDLGWFYGTFSSIVGGPSVLALLQMVFVEHRLVDALQWIVDGYSQITAELSAWVEPVFAPAIAWINERFNWQLELHAHWRPLFLLGMMIVIGRARGLFRDGKAEAVVVGMSTTLGALLGALIAGVTPLSGGWWAQGIAAAAPVAAIMFFMEIAISLWPTSPRVEALLRHKTTRLERLRDFAFSIGTMAALVCPLVFALAAGVSFIPGLAMGAGALTLGGLVLYVGASSLLGSLGKDAPSYGGARMGFIVLGGFFTAGLILAADLIIKLLT